MNNAAKTSLYFSAYPLKAVEKAMATAKEGTQSPYLRALLAGKPKTTNNRLRVSPMVNPYRTPNATSRPRTESKNVEPSGKEWFNHYE